MHPIAAPAAANRKTLMEVSDSVFFDGVFTETDSFIHSIVSGFWCG